LAATNVQTLRLRVFAGPNGSGKTTLIKFIKKITVKGKNWISVSMSMPMIRIYIAFYIMINCLLLDYYLLHVSFGVSSGFLRDFIGKSRTNPEETMDKPRRKIGANQATN
jgi:energy-coupling factor transporter ATP-binding protein EcfA2